MRETLPTSHKKNNTSSPGKGLVTMVTTEIRDVIIKTVPDRVRNLVR